jgi:pilus assembly protein CpaC
MLPVIPKTPNRPALPPGQSWETDRLRTPVGSFVDSLKGTDAALEVILGQGRLLSLKQELADPETTTVVAVGDPTVVDFEVLPNTRMIRLTGLRTGVTDLSVLLANGEAYSLEVHVVYDLSLLKAQLKQIFPNAQLQLGQVREHLVVEGQARSARQVTQIISTIRYYLASIQVSRSASGESGGATPEGSPGGRRRRGAEEDRGQGDSEEEPSDQESEDPERRAAGEDSGRPDVQATIAAAQIINLIQVPGTQQVLLKVRLAELDRTAMRQIGADLSGVSSSGSILGTQIGGAAVAAMSDLGLGGLVGTATAATATNSTAFGLFPSGDFDVILRVLRENALARVLAEPNLVPLSGHQASFLSGGEFPVPVPQGGLGIGNTIQFKEFGVQLQFTPYVLADDRVRLAVTPEVSNLDFTIGTTITPGGSPVPGLNSRRATTTVELEQGQTLAIAGLVSVEIGGETSRIPLLGDLPYIGPLFSNTGHRRIERELLVIVTPYLVEGTNDPVSMPGEDILEPNDKELFFLNRIQGRTGVPHRSTTQYECFDQTHGECHHTTPQEFHGPVGFSAP